MIAILVVSILIVIIMVLFLLSVIHNIEYNNSSWTQGDFCNSCDSIISPYDSVCWKCGNGANYVHTANWTKRRVYRKRMFKSIEFKDARR